MRRVAAALAVVVTLAAALLPACGGGGDGHYRMVAWFDKAVALYPHSDVRVLGLPAGEVTDITVVGTRVRVTMRIDDDVPVPADVGATIVPFSLIGERYVQLFPAYVEGQPRARPGVEIPLERTSIPVEPDEALAALKKFLDSLDPKATGRLVKNLADDLEGNGARVNESLEGLARLASTLADKDDELVAIFEHLDKLTATLRTREARIGRVLDDFAQAASLLAEERRAIESLVHGLSRLSTDGLDLVSEHRVRLERDVEVVTGVLQAVSANLDSVLALVDSGPLLVAGPNLDGKRGLAGAYDAKYHHLDLRNSTTPTVAQLFAALGVPALTVCVPGIDVQCTAPAGASPAAAPGSEAAVSQPPSTAASPAGDSRAEPGPPIGGNRARKANTISSNRPADSAAPLTGGPSPTRDRGRGPVRWLRHAAKTLVEVVG